MRCTGKRSRSRDAFFVRTRVIGTPFPKTTPPTRPSSDAPDSGTAGRTTIGRGARRFVGWAKARNAPCPRVSQNAFLKTVFLKTAWASLRSTHPTKRTKTKGSRTPTDAGLPASPSGEARTLARARSPVGVPLRLSPGRQLVPKAQRQAMLSGTVRSVRSCTAAPTGERRPCASPCMIRKSGCRFSGKIMHHSRALPAPNKSQCSEHLTCRSLCRQADARRRPSAEGTNPLPASTGPAPASPSSLGWRPVRGAR
jgi:hypothetical protein